MTASDVEVTPIIGSGLGHSICQPCLCGPYCSISANMSRIMDVSNKLGEYMLKGWVLTDAPCPNASSGCRVPLLRSPNGVSPVVEFCANCDGDPPSTSQANRSNLSLQPLTINATSDNSSESHNSRSTTPPTEISSALSSPTFAPPLETEESRRRREQSDRASAEIGKRLLKGWAMLADECPNPNCYGVPLVRPAKAGGGKDPRKECVICNTVYVDSIDEQGYNRLVPLQLQFDRQAVEPTTNESTQTSKKKEDSTPVVPPSQVWGEPHNLSQFTNHRATSNVQALESALQTKPDIIDVSIHNLELALSTLSHKLSVLSNAQTHPDVIAIASTAEAIGKVAEALDRIYELQKKIGSVA